MTDVIVNNLLLNVPNNCIICLQDNPTIIQFRGTCKCTPNLHSECLDKWLKNNSLTCPICRKKFNTNTTDNQPIDHMNINVVILNNNPPPNNHVNNGEDTCRSACSCVVILWIFTILILSFSGVLR
jgi:hypothetical protein